MKVSYSLLKEFVPKLPPKDKLIELLSLRAFEAEEIPGESNIFEIKIPANRYSDAASYWGLARIISATLGIPAVIPGIRLPATSYKPKAKSFSVSIETKTCRGMRAWHISGLKVGPSPKWLADAVQSAGMNSINNVVDITNYVMIETGQPLHAFDYDRIAQHRMVIRPAEPGEELETLDGKKFKLNTNIAVIADAEKALDVAGIKGGKDSGITEQTTSILLTGGNWDGAVIYKTARALGLHTDASARFSHNLSPALTAIGVSRGAELIAELAGGKLGEAIAVGKLEVKPLTIPFDVKRFNGLTGFDLTAAQCFNYLKKLGFIIKGKNVVVPGNRTDVWGVEDLIEEVVNVHGYDRLTEQKPTIEMVPAKTDDTVILKDAVRDYLVRAGSDEAYTYSFIHELDATKHAPARAQTFALANPISAEVSTLRPRLLAGLIKTVLTNERTYEQGSIFEIGSVFWRLNTSIVEKTHCGLAGWGHGQQTTARVKGTVEGLLAHLGITYSTNAIDDPVSSLNRFLRTAQSMVFVSDGVTIGYVGVSASHPHITVAELYLSDIVKLPRNQRTFTELPKFPSVIRDLSTLADISLKSGDVIQTALEGKYPALTDATLADSFVGGKLPKDKKSLTFRFTFQMKDRTLTDAEVNATFAKLTTDLKFKFGFDIR